MLYILLATIFLLPTFLGIGKLMDFLLKINLKSISLISILGISTITSFWTVLAFFIPLNLGAEIATILVGMFSFYYFKLYELLWSFLKVNGKMFLGIFIVIVFAGSYFPFILDHFGYYLPTIKWISEIGLVKGISNLDLLLGQMSLWHVLQAGFSNFSDPFLRLNSVVLIIYLIYILEKKSFLHLVFFPFLFLFSQSPSPDLPVIVFSLIILNEILSGSQKTSFLFMASALVFGIKPTMIWLPFFVFLYGFFILKSNLRFLLFGALILLLFLAKNIWCFGFPIFPVQFGDIGVSWKPNQDLLKISSQTAIEKTYDMQYKFAEIQRFSTWDYIKNWFTLKGIKSKIHLFFIIALISLTIFTFFKKNKILIFLCLAIVLKSILVLLFSAQYRFFIDVFFVSFFVFFYQSISKRKAILVFSSLSMIVMGFLSFPNLVKTIFPSFKLGQFMAGFQKSQWNEPAHFAWNQYETHQIGNLKFNVVKSYPFSFDSNLPAISPEFLKEDLAAGIFPQVNSKELKNGFHWRKLSESEKIQLKIIVDRIYKE